MMKQFARTLTAALLSSLLAVGSATPAFAQSQDAVQSPTQATKPANSPAPLISLESSKYKYTRAPRAFPNLLAPYYPISVPQPDANNSARLEQMIHDGKLELSLQDAVELALQNNMDIAVARYNPWFADTDILKAESGGVGRGTAGAAFPFSNANIPFLNFDPLVTGTLLYDRQAVPVNNPFLAGTGTGSSVTALQTHTAQYNFGVTQGFSSGTTVNLAWDNTRSSSSAAFNSFNPAVQSSLYVTVSQQLLNGFGFFANRRNIIIAKNNRKIADLAFAQQAIATVTGAINTYWELVYARQNVDVQQQAVTVAEKLYNDNKKQLEIGTMAPLDVTRAESELATDNQNLIVARTAQLQQEQNLKNAISKDPLAANFVNVQVIPTDKPTPPETIEAPSFEESVREAFSKRPDLQEQIYNVKNADIDARATRTALLPIATLNGRYGSQGLSGNTSITGTPVTTGVTPVVGATGLPVFGTDAAGNVIPIFLPNVTTPVVGTNSSGFGTAQSQIFHNTFPDYAVYMNLQIPIRNRSNQADNQRAILTARQQQAVYQQLKNVALLDVRNTYIALLQDRARVDAAAKASELQRQTFEAEQKKYQLGASTVYNVILTQRDYITAQGTQLRALADLVEAKANYERALGRTLEVNRVTIAEGKSGNVDQETLIPGTLNGKVVGTDALFKKLDAENPRLADPAAADTKK
jgi:outer membrane protein TolC